MTTFDEAREIARKRAHTDYVHGSLTIDGLVKRLTAHELNKAALAIVRKVPDAVRRDVMSSGACHYCGDFPTQVDHVIPVTRGGTSARDNLVAACRRCNLEKLDYTPDEWRAYRASIGASWPPPTFHSEISTLFVQVNRAR